MGGAAAARARDDSPDDSGLLLHLHLLDEAPTVRKHTSLRRRRRPRRSFADPLSRSLSRDLRLNARTFSDPPAPPLSQDAERSDKWTPRLSRARRKGVRRRPRLALGAHPGGPAGAGARGGGRDSGAHDVTLLPAVCPTSGSPDASE